MPFQKVNVSEIIEETLNGDEELRQMWEGSRMEYTVLGDLVKIRNSKGISQFELAQKSGNERAATNFPHRKQGKQPNP